MIRKKIQKCTKYIVALMVAAMCVLSAGVTTAYANVDQAAVEAAEAEALSGEEGIVPEETESTEEAVIDRSQSFSIPGNGEVLDDISNDSTKEFYTIRTANNNTFYLVIDKSSTSENVYMLSMIDEADLEEFLTETETEAESEAVITTPPVVIEEETEPETLAEEVQAESSSQNNAGSLIIIGIVALAGIGGYFLYKRKKKDDGFVTENEGLEYDDRLESVNEDEAEDAEDTETLE